MRTMRTSFCTLLTLVTSISFGQDWAQVSDFPGVHRDDGTAFTIGDTAYFGTGISPWFTTQKDFYGLDLSTDEWFTIASLPDGKERQYAVSFADEQKGFVFGGYNGNDFLNDLWKYNPVTNSWVEMTSLPGSGRSGSTCFVLNDTAYIIGGKTANEIAIDEVWAYAIGSDSWIQKNNLTFGNRWRASATQTDTKGYLMFGRDEVDHFHNELLEYSPATDTWTQVSNFPIIGRSHASMHAIGDELLIFFGRDSLNNSHNDLWTYNIIHQSWNLLSGLPSVGRRGGMSIVSNQNMIYYATGLNGQNQRLKETWKYHESLGTDNIEQADQKPKLIKVVDLLGRDVKPMPNMLLIYIYEDGSAKKIYKLE